MGPRGQAHASPLMRLLLAHTAAPWRPAPAATRPLTPAAVGPCQQGWLAGGTQVWESHIQTPLASASQSVGPCPLLFHCPCRHAKLYVPATDARAVLTPEEEGSVVLHLTRTL